MNIQSSAAVFLVFLALTVQAGAADIKEIAQAVDEHYNHLSSLQAEFTEIYTGSGMERTESGMVWLKKPGMKKPGKMRWEYRSPREKLFVSDGNDAWFYVPGDRQARKTSARKLDDIRSPMAFLLGKTKLEKELQALSLAPDIPPTAPENVVLRGVPRALADSVNEILLEIAPDKRIVRIVLDEVDGSVTEYRLTDQHEDESISDS